MPSGAERILHFPPATRLNCRRNLIFKLNARIFTARIASVRSSKFIKSSNKDCSSQILSSCTEQLTTTMTIISLFVSSPETYSERRLDSSLTVSELKVSGVWADAPGSTWWLQAADLADAIAQDKLVPITGIQPQYQTLHLQRSAEDSEVLARLDNEDATLGSYSPQEYQCLRVCLPSARKSVRCDNDTKELT